MGNLESAWWIVVECACRILGVSTATVLCAVGVETVHRGEFTSLGIYLLVSAVAIMVFEMAYFLDALLFMCLPFPPDWQLFVMWGKMARIGGFHKFLYYSIMSVVCFLHPVLVWHAVIPGIMLLVTAIFNFILSKKTNTKTHKRPHDSDQGLTTVCVPETGNRAAQAALTARDRRESVQAMLQSQEQTPSSPKDVDGERKRRRWKERRLMCLRGREEPVEREMEEMESYCEAEPADTTSDTAPMITD